MAYSKFVSLARLCQQYSLTVSTLQPLFRGVAPVAPSPRLKDDLEEAQSLPIYTEKAKSELIITPIMRELRRNHPGITFFSGFALNIDGDPDLNGNPDFVLSAKPNIIEIEAPIFCLTETKNKTPDEGYAQCAAEIYAAWLFNQKMNNEINTIYGSVSNGFEWVFLKYESNVIHIDRDRYYLNDLPAILGIFASMIPA